MCAGWGVGKEGHEVLRQSGGRQERRTTVPTSIIHIILYRQVILEMKSQRTNGQNIIVV